MSVSTCIYVYRVWWCPWRPVKDAGVSYNGCEPPGGAGNRTQILFKNSKVLLATGHLFSSLVSRNVFMQLNEKILG